MSWWYWLNIKCVHKQNSIIRGKWCVHSYATCLEIEVPGILNPVCGPFSHFIVMVIGRPASLNLIRCRKLGFCSGVDLSPGMFQRGQCFIRHCVGKEWCVITYSMFVNIHVGIGINDGFLTNTFGRVTQNEKYNKNNFQYSEVICLIQWYLLVLLYFEFCLKILIRGYGQKLIFWPWGRFWAFWPNRWSCTGCTGCTGW